jgi:hypothetical protein
MAAIFASNGRAPLAFRVVLLASAGSLAAYIVFKLATQLHATTGIYYLVFPLSSILSAVGILLAVKPESACDCSATTRATVGGLAIAWLATGLVCSPALVEQIGESPLAGLLASLHMVVQHILLTVGIIAFALKPRAMAEWLASPGAHRPAARGDAAGLANPGD